MARLRQLVDRIEIQPAGRGRPPAVLLHGRVSELLNLTERAPGSPLSSRVLVAGERYQRYSGLFSARIPRLPRPL
jgi:hypothetical protein